MNTRLFFHLWRHELYRLRWQAAAATVVSAVCLGLSVRSAWTYGPMRTDPKTMMMLSHLLASISSIVTATLFGMHAATGERSAGTHLFIRALPVSASALGVARLLASIVASIAVLSPMATSLFYLSGNEVYWLLTINGLIGVGVLLWIATFGLGRSTALSAAVAGWGAIVVWGGLANWHSNLSEQHELLFSERSLWAIGPPFHWWIRMMNPRTHAIAAPQLADVGLTSLALGAIAIIFVLRYHRALEPSSARQNRALSLPRLLNPLLIRWPLIWKTVSDLSPLSILVFPWILLAAVSWYDQAGGSALLHNYISPIVSVGNFLLPVMVGVHLFVADLQPGLNRFWRSRAISPRQFFWTRLLGGLASIAVLLWLPMLVAIQCLYGDRPPWLELFVSGGLSFVVYLHAVGFACWLRHTLYSGILAVGALVFLVAVPLATGEVFWPGFDEQHPITLSILFGLLFASSLAMTWLAAWSVTRDRHWSQVSG